MNDTEPQTAFSNRGNARSWALRALAYCRRTFVKAGDRVQISRTRSSF